MLSYNNFNNFNKKKWWEKLLICLFGTPLLREYTHQTVLFVPTTASIILNDIGIVGTKACIIALSILAIYTIILVLCEFYYDKKLE